MNEYIAPKQERFLLVSGGSLILIWWFIIKHILPTAYDPIYLRILITSFCFSAFGLSLVFDFVKRILSKFVLITVWLITYYIFFLTAKNNAHFIFILAMVLTVFCCTFCLNSRRQILTYFLFCLAMSYDLADKNTQMNGLFIQSVLITLFIISYIGFYYKLRLLEVTKEINEKLQKSETALREAQKIAKIGSFEFDFKNKKKRWSPQAALNFGLDEKFLPDNFDLKSFLETEDYLEVKKKWGMSIRSIEPFDFQFKIKKRDNKTRWIHAMGKHVFDHLGEHSLSIGTIQDITERSSLDAEIKEEQTKLMQTERMSSLGEMAGGIAHEINNPLSVILGHAEILKRIEKADSPLETEVISKHAEKIISTVNRIAKIVSGLRVFARDASCDPFHEVTIQSILEETLEFCTNRFRTHNVKLILEPVSPEIKIICRSVQISQIILNLLNNAFDVTSDIGGSWIKIDVKESPSEVHISVSNNGPLINQEIREKIFLPFFTTKEVGKGTGLGLSIARSIAVEHKGRLELDTDSQTTCFTLSIPRL